jgi:hypothetical protein
LVKISIIGKEFECIKFNSDDRLFYSDEQYGQYIGVVGKVDNIHSQYPKYTCISFPNGDTRHFYTKDVEDQISYKLSNDYINDLYTIIFKILIDNDKYFDQRKSIR